MKVIVLLLLTCELCWTIRVPVSWDEGESDVKQDTESDEKFSVETFKRQDELASEDHSREALKPRDEKTKPQIKPSIPVEYFEYTAKKPQFAVNVAAFHGVQSPENHYKAYPIRPYTGRVKPELRKHHILDSENHLHKPFQDYTKINEDVNPTNPVSSSYEVFHPYEAETPALQEIYRDPVLNKIRSDLENSKSRLQQYEKDASEPDITKDEYLESPQRTDDKLFPQRHRQAPFEIHRPQRRPVYYQPVPVYKSREHYLNQKLRSPWNHNIAKVRPVHYRPIQNHIQHLRQHHALKYDDERNEYPQVQIYEDISDPKDGHDIYERGKDKFQQLRNNVDESINNAAKENRPTTYQNLESQDNESESASNEDDDDEQEYVPIKNYAQVRKTETFRHFPRSAALEDARTFDEIKNSPRLREAVKSTKAQTVYSEEGYEDAAYDHAGEQKHASENEGHGGFLKEHELSGGKYKAPTVSANYKDGEGSVYRDQNIHAEKWKDDNKDTKEEADEEEYDEDEHEHLLEADNFQTDPQDEENHRNKRENALINETLSSSDVQSNFTEDIQHEVDEREVNFEVPQVDLNSTFFKDNQFQKLARLKLVPKKDTLKQKYPYYFKNLKTLSRNSPLRYAENLKLIPLKTKGGTEFYDSRSKFECPEVDDVPDPIPEKLKGDGHPDENNGESGQLPAKNDENFDTTKKQPRLKGLGDKIDCFKAKYFGENPLDSPFFKEDIISNPEPVFLPNIASYKLKTPFLLNLKEKKAEESKNHNVFENLHENNTFDLFDLIEKLRSEQGVYQTTITKPKNESVLPLETLNENKHSNITNLDDQSSVYNDVIKNIKTSFLDSAPQTSLNNITHASHILYSDKPTNNIIYTHFQHKEDITKSPITRKRRAAPFVYEPYKIIRDTQIQDDLKKTTMVSNLSPLIKQLQSSRVIETVNKLHPKDIQHTKRDVNARSYKDIGQKDREIKIKYGSSKNDKNYEDTEIVDVSIDKRRGEPRYEIKHENHKPRYTPVTNQKSMTKRDYESQVSDDVSSTSKTRGESIYTRPVKQRKSTEKPYFDVSKFIPQRAELQSTTESFTIKGPVPKVTSSVKPKVSSYVVEKHDQDRDSGSDEDYEEYDEQDESEKISKISSTTTTSTTPKPVFRRKVRTQTTTQEPIGFVDEPRLKLVTRFRDYKPKHHLDNRHQLSQTEENRKNPIEKIVNKETSDDDKTFPQIREKKKKLTKSTIVTDSKRYGDVLEDKDKMMKDEVDALIGVKHDMDDYVPLYEKEEEYKSKATASKKNDKKTYAKDVDDEDDADDDDDDEEVNDDETIDDDEDGDEEYIDDNENDDEDEDDDERESDSVSASEEENENIEVEPRVTTPEPTKRTLVITTDAPIPTIATRSAKLQARPIITRKKMEIHKELPVNKSSPHTSQYKQDIKEIEIIKESRNPVRRKLNKNVEVFDLYKDDNLAKDINKLGVEVFKENLDLRQGPKHGGNYRSIESSTTKPSHQKAQNSEDDAETSQSEFKKNVESDENKSNSQTIRNRGRNSKLIELTDTPDSKMHGGNLRYRGRSRNNNEKSQKLIELDDEHEDDSSNESLEDKSYSSSRRRPMHGGNYRSAQLRDEKPPTTESAKLQSRDTRQNAALVLNSFVQAAPVLTTKPAYILDPSQRKYYYVDT